jgi:hypothetical protein
MMRVPARASLMAFVGPLAVWEIAARLIGIDGLPPASRALRQVPAPLGNAESLLHIASSLRRMRAASHSAWRWPSRSGWR